MIYASPVSSLTPTEEQQTRNKVNYLKKSRASIGVLRNRLFLLRDKDRGESLASLAQALAIILTDNKSIVMFSFEEDKHKLLSIVNLEIGKDTPKDISLYGSGTLQIIEILLALYEDKNNDELGFIRRTR